VFLEAKEMRERLSFKLCGIDSDGGSEFINDEMCQHCLKEDITFARGRANKKNDGCHIEQKSWSLVRQTVGYSRFELISF
jgi:hypothetical protein